MFKKNNLEDIVAAEKNVNIFQTYKTQITLTEEKMTDKQKLTVLQQLKTSLNCLFTVFIIN
jgi:hypothetical protein